MPTNRCWGFDFCEPAEQGWTQDGGGSPGRDNSTFRNGTHSLVGSGSDLISPSFGNLATIYVGAAVRWNYLMNKRILQLRDGTSDQLTVTVETDGTLRIRRGNQSGTVLASSTAGLFTATVWHHLQLSASIHGTTGAVELKLNGVTVASASGINTSNSGANQVSVLRLTAPDGLTEGRFDDVYVTDTAFLGDCKVEAIYPSGAGNSSQWTANGAANNYQCVDESGSQDDDTTYVETDTVNNLDLYAMGNLVTASGTVRIIGLHHTSRKDDSGTRGIKPVLRSAGANSERAEVTLTTTYTVGSEWLTQDPTDAMALTISKVNAFEFGVKLTT